MSNSENMTLAERLAQKLKASPMGELLDEDDLGELCKRAIEDAFFKPRVVKDGYRVETLEPAILSEARGLFKAAMEPLIKKAAEDLAEKPEFRDLLAQAAIAVLPDMMLNFARTTISEASMRGANEAVARVNEMARTGMLGR